jgi:hypothetical protein
VSSATPALIAAAAGVGFAHAIMPDHWVPLAVFGRTRGYPLARVARLSGTAGVAHVLVSLLLGALLVAIGLQLRATVQHAQDVIVGGVLLATGAGFVALELSGRGHGHRHGHQGHNRGHDHDAHDHHAHDDDRPDHEHESGAGHLGGLAGVIVPFGAAASPDLTILPVFVAAAAVGAVTAIASLIAFALVTIATIVTLTLLAAFGGYQVRGRWLERWANAVTAVVLVTIGLLVLTGTI